MAEKKNMLTIVGQIFDRLSKSEWLMILGVRIAVGLMFAGTGWVKLGKLHEYTEYFVKLGIPAASIQAPFVAALECVGGILLLVGGGTRVFAAMLSGTMVVAILTARLKEAVLDKPVGAFDKLLEFLYLNEWLLLLLLVWLVFSGPGKVSVDQWLAAKLRKTSPEQ